MEAEHCVASLCTRAVLHGACAERKVALLWTRKLSLLKYGGCDYVTCEASFEDEACDQSRHAGAWGSRFDVCARGRRIGIGGADSGRAADDEPRANPGAHARRRRNRRRQSGHVLSVRQGKHGTGSGRRTAGPRLRLRPWLRRLSWLPWLRRPWLPRLRLRRRLRRLRRRLLLRYMGFLPLLLNPSACLPTQSTNQDRDGRVRQGRPGHSMSAFHGPMWIIRAQRDAAMMAARVFNPFKKC